MLVYQNVSQSPKMKLSGSFWEGSPWFPYPTQPSRDFKVGGFGCGKKNAGLFVVYNMDFQILNAIYKKQTSSNIVPFRWDSSKKNTSEN